MTELCEFLKGLCIHCGDTEQDECEGWNPPPNKELQESFKLGYDAGVLETQLAQAKDRNFCPRCGKRLMSALGPVSIHTCCPPNGRTFDDYGNKII